MWKHPPGDEIYRKGNISVFEVDGKKNKVNKRCARNILPEGQLNWETHKQLPTTKRRMFVIMLYRY